MPDRLTGANASGRMCNDMKLRCDSVVCAHGSSIGEFGTSTGPVEGSCTRLAALDGRNGLHLAGEDVVRRCHHTIAEHLMVGTR